MPDLETPKKYWPAVLLGRKAKGVPKKYSKSERRRRRERILAMIEERDRKRNEIRALESL